MVYLAFTEKQNKIYFFRIEVNRHILVHTNIQMYLFLEILAQTYEQRERKRYITQPLRKGTFHYVGGSDGIQINGLTDR